MAGTSGEADMVRQAATVAGATTVAAASDSVSTNSEAILTPELDAIDEDLAQLPQLTDSINFNPSIDESEPLDTPTLGPIKSPKLSRSNSFGSSSFQDDDDSFPPLDRLTVLDILDNFALPQHLEKLQRGISAQTEKIKRSRDAFKSRGELARDRMVEEWRRRVPSTEEQLERYRKRVRTSVEKLGNRWNDTKVITLREKISFICGVMNVFISGFLIGGYPELFHLWYTAQLAYFMPVRFYTYRRRGYHYFLADLCYFVNFLLTLSLWVLPTSKRLFMAAYCLSYGNNAVAIIMWRNSLVFHSFDKVTSLFIHIMPCATLHCIVHLWPDHLLAEHFPAVWTIKNSPPGSPTAYANLISMLAWSTLPYALWQLSYYFFITVSRRDKIAAGRPTSFTWLRRSYSKTWIGRFVLSLPTSLQETAFMLIQYSYAVLTMLPCPIWFYSRWASSGFMMLVFTWSVYNGATYYIDVFGKRFQKDLEKMKREVARLQEEHESLGSTSPLAIPEDEKSSIAGVKVATIQERDNTLSESHTTYKNHRKQSSFDIIPLLDDKGEATCVDSSAKDIVRERKCGTSFDKVK